MKIIQRGINLRVYKPKPIVCPKCGCIFEVLHAGDVAYSKFKNPLNGISTEQMVVKCPNSSCSFERALDSEKLAWVKQNIGGTWNEKSNNPR